MGVSVKSQMIKNESESWRYHTVDDQLFHVCAEAYSTMGLELFAVYVRDNINEILAKRALNNYSNLVKSVE
jgi:hypothetical protein